MTPEQYKNQLLALSANQNADEMNFSKVVCHLLKDKLVEIYIGDSYEDIKFQDSSEKISAVICGRILACVGECMAIECAYVPAGTNTLRFGNIVLVNERAVRTISELDGKGSLQDTFLSSKESLQIKKACDQGDL